MLISADGCKAGWLVAVGEGWPCNKTPHLYVIRDFSALLALAGSAHIVVVDIPMGLPQGKERRLCDIQARELLGRQARNRVFFAPPRETLAANTPDAFQEIHKRARGVGVEYPVWGIVPKLREVDATMTPELQRQVLEFHPELVWWRLNNKKSLTPKHKQEGIRQRMSILNGSIPGFSSILRWQERLGRAAKLDDLLDALVGLAVGEQLASGSTPVHRLPASEPPKDELGLRMEIWY